jgi:hypothetical protein
LKPSDIPYVELEGAILDKPPDEEKMPPMPSSFNMITAEQRLDKIESALGQLATAISILAANRTVASPGIVASSTTQAPVPAPVPTEQQKVDCPACAKEFADTRAMKMHYGRFHKEETKNV